MQRQETVKEDRARDPSGGGSLDRMHARKGSRTQLWRDLRQEKDFVGTNNGKPVAILTSTDADSFERSLLDIRQSRAKAALADLQRDAAARGLDKLSMDEIDAEV